MPDLVQCTGAWRSQAARCLHSRTPMAARLAPT